MSSGEIVSISNNGIGWIPYTGVEIIRQFTYFQNYADEQRSSLSKAIDELSSLISEYDPDLSEVDVVIPIVDGPSFPSVPEFGVLDLANYPENELVTPVFMPYPDLDFEYVTPTAPSEIDPTWNYNIEDYTSAMWSALFNKVHGDIISGGTGLTDVVYSAIVSREREARRINQNREYSSGLNAVGSRGFNLPAGHVAAFQSEFQREILKRDQDSVNNVVIKDFDLATENTRFSVTTGKDLEQILRSTWEVVQKVGLEAEKAASEYVLSVYDANIKKYLAEWEGVKLELEALKTQVEAIASYNESLVKVWLGEIEAYSTEIKAIVEQNDGIVKVRGMEVSIYETEVKAISVQYDALIKEAALTLDAAKVEIDQEMGNLKINLDSFIAENSLAEKIAESKATIAAQSIASALGAINTSMSQGYSSGESLSETWSHGESLGESHNFSE